MANNNHCYSCSKLLRDVNDPDYCESCNALTFNQSNIQNWASIPTQVQNKRNILKGLGIKDADFDVVQPPHNNLLGALLTLDGEFRSFVVRESIPHDGTNVAFHPTIAALSNHGRNAIRVNAGQQPNSDIQLREVIIDLEQRQKSTVRVSLIPPESIDMLTQNPQANPNFRVLRKLTLVNLQIDDTGGQNLFQNLLSNTNITHLNVSHNHFNNASGQAIADALRDAKTRNCGLESLDLEYVGLTPDHALLIADALPRNDTLEHLSLRGNQLNDAVYQRFFDNLYPDENTTLRHLDITNNRNNPLSADTELQLNMLLMFRRDEFGEDHLIILHDNM